MSLLLLLALLAGIDGETGTLRVHSQPGAEVVWEGVALGTTDTRGVLMVSDIPPGTFTLALRKSGFRDFETSVTVSAGETTSLEAELRPVASPPASAPARKRAQATRQQEPAKRAQTAADPDQDKRLNQTLKSPPRERPLPVSPASSRPAAETAETGVPLLVWPLLLGGMLLIVVLWLSRKLRPTAFTRSPALLGRSEVPQPAHIPEKTAAFLSDLKKREELLEQGVEIVPNRPKGPVIDLDSASVREVEEP